MAAETLRRLQSQAKLQLKKRDTGKDIFERLPAEPERGFARMPKPSPEDIFFDMEGVTETFVPGGLEYLFGIYYQFEGEQLFSPIWAHDHEQERAATIKILDFLIQHLSSHPDAHIYHYNHYEVTALKLLTSKYGVRESELDELLRKRKFIDLFKVVKEGILQFLNQNTPPKISKHST